MYLKVYTRGDLCLSGETPQQSKVVRICTNSIITSNCHNKTSTCDVYIRISVRCAAHSMQHFFLFLLI
jgi:hypothetical protein